MSIMIDQVISIVVKIQNILYTLSIRMNNTNLLCLPSTIWYKDVQMTGIKGSIKRKNPTLIQDNELPGPNIALSPDQFCIHLGIHLYSL